MVGGKFPQGREELEVGKLYDRIELVKFVLQGGAGNDEGMLAGDGLDGLGGLGLEIFNTLCFIKYNQVRAIMADSQDIPHGCFIVGNLEIGHVFRVETLADFFRP